MKWIVVIVLLAGCDRIVELSPAPDAPAHDGVPLANGDGELDDGGADLDGGLADAPPAD